MGSERWLQRGPLQVGRAVVLPPHLTAAVFVQGRKEKEQQASARTAGLLSSRADGLPQAPPLLAPPPAPRPALSGTGILSPSAHNLGPRNRSKWRHHSRFCDPAHMAQSSSLTYISPLPTLPPPRGRSGGPHGEGLSGMKPRGQRQESG